MSLVIWETITARAKVNNAHIAVGVGPQYADKTIMGAELAAKEGYARVTLVGSKPMDTALDTVISDKPEADLIELLKAG